jgi:signal transduction histidine kinase/CHASE2 domain-containing sensor protein
MRWLYTLRTFRSWIVALPRPASGLLLGIGCALLVQAWVSSGWMDGLDRGALDALFRARGSRFAAPQIVLVVASDETISRYNAWPLPRHVYAALVRRLHREGVQTVAFDLLFSEPSPRPGDDRAFAVACRDAGNVIQASAFHIENIYNPTLPVGATALSKRLSPRFSLSETAGSQSTPFSPLPSAVWMSAPLPELQQSAPLLGHINVHPRHDGALRLIPHAIRYRNELYPSLALAAAAHYLGVPARRITVTPTEILIAGRRLPIEANGETGINWAGGNGTFSTYSVSQVLGGEVPREALQGKIVLVGATAAGSYEYRATPFSSLQPAVEVQANALDNILENRPLYFTASWARFALLLAFAVLAGLLIAPRLDLSGTLLLVGLCGVLWLTAWQLLAKQNLYLPIAPPILAAALTYALAMTINYRQEWEANFRADAAVAALARGGALLALGHTRARLHNVIRATASDVLRAREIFLVRNTTQLQEAGNEPSQDELLQALAANLSTRRRAVFYPFPRRASALERPFAPAPELEAILHALARRMTQAGDKPGRVSSLVAAPLVPTKAPDSESGDRPPRAAGALVAVGSRETRCFGFRDAVLLETLAEQAGLALENLEYSELLRGRVELANRDLREAYAVLAEQSAKFMAAVESIDDALVICDASGQAIFTNGGAAPTLRFATPQLGDNVPQLLRAHGLDPIATLFDCIELHARSQADVPLVMPAPTEPVRCEVEVGEATLSPANEDEAADKNRARVLAAQLTPLYADGGKPIGAMLLVADVTAQRELDQMKTDFVSFVAHELRSPLSAILGYASLLDQYSDHTDAATRREMTEAITRQCHRLNRLIGDLLDISRLDAGRPLDLRREKVELRSVIGKVLDAQRAAQSNDKITFRLACDEAAISIWGDPDRIEQILINLISNAVKYSPEGGQVLVSLEESHEDGANGVVIRVRDPGLGMTPEQIEQLFQKYYRTPDARFRGIKGTGLGLFLVKNLVEAHRGKITIESAVGQGTTFSIWLPQRNSEGESEGPSSPFLPDGATDHSH